MIKTIGTKSYDRKYLRDQKLLKFFIVTKNKNWDIYREQKCIQPIIMIYDLFN
jgi:hypothetical protein